MNKIVCENYKALGPELRKIRIAKKLKLRPLEASSGISVSTLSMIEQGKQYPRIHTLMSYAKALGIDEVIIKTSDT